MSGKAKGTKRKSRKQPPPTPARRMCRWTAIAMVLYVVAMCCAGSYMMRGTAREIADRKQDWPDFLWSRFESYGNWTNFILEGLGWRGADAVYSYDVPAPEGSIYFAGAPVRTGPPAPKDITIVERGEFAIGWSDTLLHPAWVAYHIPREARFKQGKRPSFRRDRTIPNAPITTDYTYSGFDRGHMAPNHAIATRFGENAQRDTFQMGNISPQTPALNRGVWREIELAAADLWTARYGEIWVIVGTLPATSGQIPKIGPGIDVPAAYYAIIVAETASASNGEGGNDEPFEVRALALKFPQDIELGVFAKYYIVSIDSLEQESGLDFFPDLPEFIQNPLEAETPTRLWPVRFWDIWGLLRVHCGG